MGVLNDSRLIFPFHVVYQSLACSYCISCRLHEASRLFRLYGYDTNRADMFMPATIPKPYSYPGFSDVMHNAKWRILKGYSRDGGMGPGKAGGEILQSHRKFPKDGYD